MCIVPTDLGRVVAMFTAHRAGISNREPGLVPGEDVRAGGLTLCFEGAFEGGDTRAPLTAGAEVFGMGGLMPGQVDDQRGSQREPETDDGVDGQRRWTAAGETCDGREMLGCKGARWGLEGESQVDGGEAQVTKDASKGLNGPGVEGVREAPARWVDVQPRAELRPCPAIIADEDKHARMQVGALFERRRRRDEAMARRDSGLVGPKCRCGHMVEARHGKGRAQACQHL